VLAYVSLSLIKRMQERRLGGVIGKAAVEKSKLVFVRAMPVGAKERVVVIQYRGEEWLLGVSAGGISVLGRMNIEPAQANEQPAA
jgi:flagellar protein FliO/FliZ